MALFLLKKDGNDEIIKNTVLILNISRFCRGAF